LAVQGKCEARHDLASSGCTQRTFAPDDADPQDNGRAAASLRRPWSV